MSKRILMVEDTEDNRQIIRDLMATTEYELIEAADGVAGVAAAAAVMPDLILMDIQLPVIDGYEATRRIKANPELRHIPIIAVTAYALSGDEAKALAAGCDGYLAKPVQPACIVGKGPRIPCVREMGHCTIRHSFLPSTILQKISRSCAFALKLTAMKW
jgi:two-component system cell cycle response regulator DivK